MEFVQEYQRRRSASSYNDMLAAAAKDEALTREAMLLTKGFEMLWASGHSDIDKLCDEHVEGHDQTETTFTIAPNPATSW